MYNSKSRLAGEFISHDEIIKTLENAKLNAGNFELISAILKKAEAFKGLNYAEAAVLLACEDKTVLQKIYETANKIKEKIYGKRIVMFAPLYLSNYCINGCLYCPYHAKNADIPRKMLSQSEIAEQVIALQNMGHKRLAVETGEHPRCTIDYVLESIKTIYSVKHKNGAIRRVNVNIAATTAENYKKLKDAGIGTYILFEETYHKETYQHLHPYGPKSDYAYHTEAMDRAMQSGIDDVGIGVLFGLYKYDYDFVAMLLHAKHLEDTFGVGPHTLSVPRIRPADDVDLSEYPNALDDEKFKKIVALLRIAVPYTGIIVSTRESKEIRAEILKIGVSQISGGSRTSVGGYEKEDNSTAQFDVNDTRTLDEVTSWLLNLGYVPSFCTACYREGRVGDRFMQLAKTGQIANICSANSLITLKEYLEDYAAPETKANGETVINKEIKNIINPQVRQKTEDILDQIKKGERDFRF